jgi:hypothetical protein
MKLSSDGKLLLLIGAAMIGVAVSYFVLFPGANCGASLCATSIKFDNTGVHTKTRSLSPK